jgi:Reverse transcriptase (RNA-dependent DNA polymerase)
VPVRTDPISSYPILKRAGGVRVMAVLSDRDARRWHDLAGRVGPVLEGRLPHSVLADRLTAVPGGWRFRPVRPAFDEAREACIRLARGGGVLVQADVASFYPSVTPSVLASAVIDAGGDPADAGLAAALLEGWGSEGYLGLPIGPRGSAILANAVLRPVDDSMDGRPFLRWVDDYLIVCSDERDAARALDRIDETLDRMALRRAVTKTRMEEPRRSIRWLGISHPC